MTQILKRLEIIKSSIAIEDEEIIDLQIMKLNKLDIEDDVIWILKSLEEKDYANAILSIEEYLKRYSGVVQYVDNEIQALKLELKNLESTLQELIIEKTEYLNNIDEFNKEYNLHLGELIKTILNLKKEIIYKQTIKQQKAKEKYQEDIKTFEETKETIDELKDTISQLKDALEDIDEDDENYDEILNAYKELQEELEKLEDELSSQKEALEGAKEFIEDEEIEKEYEDINSSYEEYENEYENIKDEYDSKLEISDEEKKELKKLYKKAARLCHPDIVPDELKEKAHELMQKLNEAYSKQDIKEVKKILLSLESGNGFELTSDTINDKELLKEKIQEYKVNISHLEEEIEDIKHDDTYQTISELDDWDEYFESLKSDLESEKERLEKEARVVLEEKEEIKTTKAQKSQPPKKSNSTTITKETSQYSKFIQSIENPNFEKVRRHCENLVKSDQADEMQKYLAENGKMYKALIYDSLEQFIERLDGKSITLIDWNCEQAINTMLMIDYIREKQLDISIQSIILIEENEVKLQRAISDILALDKSIKIEPYLESIEHLNLNLSHDIKLHITSNLFQLGKIKLNNNEIDNIIGNQSAENYFLFTVESQNENIINAIEEFYNYFEFFDRELIISRNTKIGRFKKFEKIFKINLQKSKIFDDITF